jgi:hypothetical protein
LDVKCGRGSDGFAVDDVGVLGHDVLVGMQNAVLLGDEESELVLHFIRWRAPTTSFDKRARCPEC